MMVKLKKIILVILLCGAVLPGPALARTLTEDQAKKVNEFLTANKKVLDDIFKELDTLESLIKQFNEILKKIESSSAYESRYTKHISKIINFVNKELRSRIDTAKSELFLVQYLSGMNKVASKRIVFTRSAQGYNFLEKKRGISSTEDLEEFLQTEYTTVWSLENNLVTSWDRVDFRIDLTTQETKFFDEFINKTGLDVVGPIWQRLDKNNSFINDSDLAVALVLTFPDLDIHNQFLSLLDKLNSALERLNDLIRGKQLSLNRMFKEREVFEGKKETRTKTGKIGLNEEKYALVRSIVDANRPIFEAIADALDKPYRMVVGGAEIGAFTPRSSRIQKVSTAAGSRPLLSPYSGLPTQRLAPSQF